MTGRDASPRAGHPGRPGNGGRRLTAAALIILLATAWIYLPVAGNGFLVVDDYYYVAINPHVTGGLTPQGVRWAFTSLYAANWHPLTWLSHMLDIELWGLNPGGHHLTSLLLHLMGAMALLGALASLTGSLGASAAATALFALHPLRVESVAWLAERKDVLAGFFGFLAIWLYGRWARRPGRARYLLLLVAYAAGLMSKAMLVSMPFVLLLLDWWPLGRMTARGGGRGGAFPRLAAEKAPLFLMAAAASVTAWIAQVKGGAVSSLDVLPLSRRLLNVPLAYLGYIRETIWPARLSFLKLFPGGPMPPWPSLAAALLLLAVSWWVVRSAARRPHLLTGWSWFLVTLLPVIGLVQIGQQAMADRYTYIPTVGLAVALTWSGRLPLRSKMERRAAAALFLAALAALSVVARERTLLWRDSFTILEHEIELDPGNWAALGSLGAALEEKGERERAMEVYTRALRLNPDNAVTNSNMGLALAIRGRFHEALPYLERVLAANPDDAEVHYNLALVLDGLGREGEAQSHLRSALAVREDYPAVHVKLGNILMRRHLAAEAAEHYLKAVDLGADRAEVHNNLGVALASLGRRAEAAEHFRAALRLRPGYAQARSNLERALERGEGRSP